MGFKYNTGFAVYSKADWWTCKANV